MPPPSPKDYPLPPHLTSPTTSAEKAHKEVWSLHSNKNCWWDGHGAIEVDTQGQAVASADSVNACKAACVRAPNRGCEAILFHKEAKLCYRKRQIDLWRCSTDPKYDLYMRDTPLPAALATPLIIDTDMSFDVDDVMAVCMAHALEDIGEVKILAIVHDAGYPKGVAALSVLSHFYGHDYIPLGAYKGKFGRDLKMPHQWKTGDYVPKLTSGHWRAPINSSAHAPDAVSVYRKALAEADDHSVVIASIGFATNLALLLKSTADEFSELDGLELVRLKVKTVVWQGGWYDARHPHLHPQWDQEFNWGCGARWYVNHTDCRGSAAFVISTLPDTVEQIFSEIGFLMPTGGPLMQCATERNPCRQALDANMRAWGMLPDEGRASWDAFVTLVAIRGATAIGARIEGQGGYNLVDANGTNVWQAGWRYPARQGYLVLDGDKNSKLMEEDLEDGYLPPAEHVLQDEINRLLCRPPKSTGDVDALMTL